MDEESHEIDWAEGQELVGATDMQTRFAKALVLGCNQTQAARNAGYAGEGAGLRGAACRMARSNKVRALVAWAKAGGAGPSDLPGDFAELKRILWKHARGKDRNYSIKATEALTRLANQEPEKVDNRSFDEMFIELMAGYKTRLAGLLAVVRYAALVADVNDGQAALTNFPESLRHYLAEVRNRFPGAWGELLATMLPHHRENAEQMANGAAPASKANGSGLGDGVDATSEHGDLVRDGQSAG